MTNIEQKLSDFNGRIENAQLIEYMSQGNIFEVIGKSRNEMMHSKMLQYLLTSGELSSSFLPLKHFLDAVVRRDSQQEEQLDENLRQAILTNSLQFKSIDRCKAEYTLADYVNEHKNCAGFADDAQKNLSARDKDRLDLYLELSIDGASRKSLEIFIENKVYSHEGDRQTQRYYEVCQAKGGQGNNKKSYKIFVYLTPLSNSLLSGYKSLDSKDKPTCSQYIQINYQDLLDYVITPMLYDTKLNARIHTLLNEYVNCLELPALPDAEITSAPKGFSIMATSQKEKDLVKAFMQVEANRTLINAACAVSESEHLYEVGQTKYLTEDDAMLLAVTEYIQKHSKWESIRFFSSVIGAQGGNFPFLIYASQTSNSELSYLPHNYYEWDGEVFASVLDAMIVALPTYINEGHPFSDFDQVYTGRGGGHLIDKNPVNNFTECKLIDSSICYINNSCEYQRERINYVFSNSCFPVIKKLNNIDNIDEYEKQISSNRYVSKYPTVPLDKYNRLGTSNFYYRRWGAKIDWFLKQPELQIKEMSNQKEYDLLRAFCCNHKSLILSVKKILIDEIDDIESRKQEEKKLQKLMKN